MRAQITLFTIICTVGCLFAVPPAVIGATAIDVPLKHWSYDALEKLACAGMIDRFLLNTKPLTRVQVAYLIRDAVDNINTGTFRQSVYNGERGNAEELLLYRLVDEFRPELVRIGMSVFQRDPSDALKTEIKMLDYAQGSLVFADIPAMESELVDNARGWRLKDGINTRKEYQMWARLHDWVSISLTPGLRMNANELDPTLEEGYIQCSLSNLLFQAGRKNLWWGPGYHGALLLSNNAPALDMLRVRNEQPFSFPWIFKKLGRYNFDFFVSQLEAKRDIPHALLGGMRLEWKPAKLFEFGFSHMVQFGGEGQTIPTVIDLFDLSKAGGGEEGENHIVSVDGQLDVSQIIRWLGLASGGYMYGEFGGEDEAGMRPVHIGYLFGVFVSDVLNIIGLDFRGEYAQTDYQWYRHFKYTTGFRYEGEIIGHHMGTDARDIFVQLSKTFSDDFTIAFNVDFQQSWISLVATQERLQVGAEFLYTMKEDLDLRTAYQLTEYRNLNYQLGNSTTNHTLTIEVQKRF